MQKGKAYRNFRISPVFPKFGEVEKPKLSEATFLSPQT